MAVDNLLAALDGRADAAPGRRDRVAVVDIGTNSTRLLVAEVEGGAVTELARESIVTRLGEGVDATGALGEAPQARVFAALDEYATAIEGHGATVRRAVMTSAVRDASQRRRVRRRRVHDALRARGRDVVSGDEEARLTFLGATDGARRRRPAARDRHRRRLDRAGRRLARRGRLPRLDPGRRRPPLRAPPAHGPADARTSSHALARRRARDHRGAPCRPRCARG